jgi:hypothetical protein
MGRQGSGRALVAATGRNDNNIDISYISYILPNELRFVYYIFYYEAIEKAME